MPFEGMPQRFLTAATDVGVGGIDEVDAQIKGRIDDLVDLFLRELICPKPICAEANDGHPGSGTP
jgi:hypothetical protein